MNDEIPKGIDSILGEDNLTKIQEDFAIPMSIRLEMLGSSERMIVGSMTYMAIHKDHTWLDYNF